MPDVVANRLEVDLGRHQSGYAGVPKGMGTRPWHVDSRLVQIEAGPCAYAVAVQRQIRCALPEEQLTAFRFGASMLQVINDGIADKG